MIATYNVVTQLVFKQLLEVKMNLINAHKTAFLYLVGVCWEVGDKHPYHFYRGETPGDNLKLKWQGKSKKGQKTKPKKCQIFPFLFYGYKTAAGNCHCTDGLIFLQVKKEETQVTASY